MKKKIIIVIIVLLTIIISSILVIKLKPKKQKDVIKTVKKEANVNISFADETSIEKNIEVFTEKFEPDVVTVIIDGVDNSNLINIDDSQLDLTKLGKYEIKYYIDYEKKHYEQIQTINVVDTVVPNITLEANNIVILVGDKYKEPGYHAEDNYDKEITDKVEITNNIDNTKPGDYNVIYKVSDSSGNETETTRKVTVKKPNVVVVTPPKEVKIEPPKVVESSYSNTLKINKFNYNNVHLEGYIKNVLDINKLKLVGDSILEFDLKVDNNNYYIDLNPEDINNGKYKLFINEEPLLNKITAIERLSRAKVGSKLVSFTYDENDEVNIEIVDYSYQYDILINPGHGGEDTGAVNEYIMEKEMNLIVSMYEKCRYESHGLRVYMTRTNDTYGANFGPDGLIKLHKLGYEMGYYGAVSKIVYSNHHNSIGNNYYSGYEILVSGSLTQDQLANELFLANKWNNIFNLTENHRRFYARNYDTDAIFSKLNGEVYTFKDYYAINRIPLTTANVKSIIFEGCYMSNKTEFEWYWQYKNWYKVSEAKIENYLNALGVPYNSDNSGCL